MAFEKAKVIKAAEKFLSQGKINAAIKEYRQIIKHDDSDLTTLNMLGDLLARAGEKEEAATCFLRIAEHYREQEFRLKAIAMYRKIEKLKPRDPAIAKELGDLYAAQGLIADARTQYLVVADAHTRAGQSKDTLEVLHKIADLDPQNTEIRLKLGEGYVKERMLPEAAKAFSQAAKSLLENSQFEKALGAYNRALELSPNNRVALKGLVSAHTKLGSADDAAEILEKAVADTPDDLELISMLAQTYIDAEDAAGAERATALLMKEDASNYRSYIEVARLHLKLGQQDEAANFLDEPAAVPSFDSFEITSETSGEAKADTLEFEWNSVAEEAPSRAGVSFADLNEAEEPAVVGTETGEQPAAKRLDGEEEVKPSSAAMMRQELESVDFYITQGYSDIAFDTLELLERQFCSHPEIHARRKKLEAASQNAGATDLEFSEPAVIDSGTKPESDAATQEIAFG